MADLAKLSILTARRRSVELNAAVFVIYRLLKEPLHKDDPKGHRRKDLGARSKSNSLQSLRSVYRSRQIGSVSAILML